MDGQSAGKKRGRPSKYTSAEEKARADVERRRELRRREAHEGRERLHAEFYGLKYTPPGEDERPTGLRIVLENPGGPKAESNDVSRPRGELESTTQRDRAEGHRHTPEARTRRLADPPEPKLCGEQLRVADLLYYSAGNASRFGRIMEFFQCGTVKCVTTFCHFSNRGAFQKW